MVYLQRIHVNGAYSNFFNNKKIVLKNLSEADSQLKRAKKDIYQIKVIHGYRGGTAIRDMVRKTYRNHPKVVRVDLPLNPGETNLILKEYF